jgi:hypothetical protein
MGAIAMQDWCFVRKGETARELWERALAPLGLKLIGRLVRHANEHGSIPSLPQDEQFATRAPKIRRTVTLTEDTARRPRRSRDRRGARSPRHREAPRRAGEGLGANWTASRMANLAGQLRRHRAPRRAR